MPVLLCYGLFIVMSVKLENEVEELLDYLFEVRWVDNDKVEEKRRKVKKTKISERESKKRKYSRSSKRKDRKKSFNFM